MSKNDYPGIIVFYGEEMPYQISMKPEFKIERKAMRFLPSDHKDNSYINNEKQKSYVVRFDEYNEEFVDTANNALDGDYNFVLTCEENPQLLCDATLNHSFLANGKKVLGAGSLFFENGSLREISNNSGHYRPSDNEMLPFIKAMNSMCLGTVVSYNSYCTNPAQTFEIVNLLELNEFNTISSSEINKMTQNSSQQSKNGGGYDNIVNQQVANTVYQTRRFGQNIPKEQRSQYEDIIKNVTRDEKVPLTSAPAPYKNMKALLTSYKEETNAPLADSLIILPPR